MDGARLFQRQLINVPGSSHANKKMKEPHSVRLFRGAL